MGSVGIEPTFEKPVFSFVPLQKSCEEVTVSSASIMLYWWMR